MQLMAMLHCSSSAESERSIQDAEVWQGRPSEFGSTYSLILMLRDGKKRPLLSFSLVAFVNLISVVPSLF